MVKELQRESRKEAEGQIGTFAAAGTFPVHMIIVVRSGRAAGSSSTVRNFARCFESSQTITWRTGHDS